MDLYDLPGMEMNAKKEGLIDQTENFIRGHLERLKGGPAFAALKARADEILWLLHNVGFQFSDSLIVVGKK